MDIATSELPPRAQYKIIAGSVTPRPIAFVSSCSPAGATNLAPYSFFNGMGANPMTVVFSPLTPADGAMKDTLRNVHPEGEGGIGEFVVNLAVEEYFQQMAACAEALPADESEFDLTGLTPAPSKVVRPPRVAESPISFECRTLQIVKPNPGAPLSANVVVGEVVHVWIRDDLVDDAWNISQEGLHTMGRIGGPSYVRTREQLPFVRGREALTTPLPWKDD